MQYSSTGSLEPATESTCLTQNVCQLIDGTYVAGLTQDECMAKMRQSIQNATSYWLGDGTTIELTNITCHYKGMPVVKVTAPNGLSYNGLQYDFTMTESECLSETIYIGESDWMEEEPPFAFVGLEAIGENAHYYLPYSDYYSWYDSNEKATYQSKNMLTEMVINEKPKDYKERLYQIIRINEDGSIRIMYNESIGYIDGFPDNGDAEAVVSAFGYGYMYGKDGSDWESGNPNNFTGCVTYTPGHKFASNSTSTYSTKTSCEAAGGAWVTSGYEATRLNMVNSEIKTKIDEWYENNLLNYSEYISDSGFCNDRSLMPGQTTNGYGEYNQVNNRLTKLYKPQFKCNDADKDLFTTSTASKGNKALTYPAALISPDEAAYAGAVMNERSNYYLNYRFQTIVSAWHGCSGGNDEICDGSSLYWHSYAQYNDVHPVINLNSSVEITKGNGTINNPYIIKTN